MPVKSWPVVLNEYETVAKLQAGDSLARFGDGELKLCDGSSYPREPVNPALAAELQQILCTPQARLLVGIPTMDRTSPKAGNWRVHAPRFLQFLAPNMPYVSAFISRSDSAPAIACVAYCEALQQCWAGKKAVVVAEETSHLPIAVRRTARTLVHIRCPQREAYAVLEDLQREVLRQCPEIVLLSHGPSATCFAARLTRLGLQALDLGSVGPMLCRLLPTRRVDHVYTFALRHPGYLGDLPAMQAALTAAGFAIYYAAEKDGTTKEKPHGGRGGPVLRGRTPYDLQTDYPHAPDRTAPPTI